jgi:Uma2 family endonuclease
MALQLEEKKVRRLYTVEEFFALAATFDDFHKYQLIDGEIITSPPAGGEHGRVAGRIIKAIARFDPDDKLGEVLTPSWIKFASGFSPAPDVIFIKRERLALCPITKAALEGIPDFVVEVWSPSNLDSKVDRDNNADKIRKYQLAGVPLIWAVNPKEQKVFVYQPNQADPVQEAGINDELDGGEVLPGFKLAVSYLFQ